MHGGHLRPRPTGPGDICESSEASLDPLHRRKLGEYFGSASAAADLVALRARELGQHRFGFCAPPLSLNRMLPSPSSFVLNFHRFVQLHSSCGFLLPRRLRRGVASRTPLLPGGTAEPGPVTPGRAQQLGDSLCLLQDTGEGRAHTARKRASEAQPGTPREDPCEGAGGQVRGGGYLPRRARPKAAAHPHGRSRRETLRRGHRARGARSDPGHSRAESVKGLRAREHAVLRVHPEVKVLGRGALGSGGGRGAEPQGRDSRAPSRLPAPAAAGGHSERSAGAGSWPRSLQSRGRGAVGGVGLRPRGCPEIGRRFTPVRPSHSCASMPHPQRSGHLPLRSGPGTRLGREGPSCPVPGPSHLPDAASAPGFHTFPRRGPP